MYTRGSVLGPMLFTIYIKPLSAIIDSHSIIHHTSNHIGLVVRMSILDTKGRRFEPQHQYVLYLSKRLYPHCFSRLSCEMSTRWGQPREGCSVL